MAYRATVATSSTEYSPYFLMFGRQFPFPIDFDLGTVDSQKPITQTDYIKKLLLKLEVARQTAQDNVKKHQKQYKHSYDRNQKPITYLPGTFVWLYSPKVPNGVSKKMFCKVTGPYYITLTMNHDTYRIRDVTKTRNTAVRYITVAYVLTTIENCLIQSLQILHKRYVRTLHQTSPRALYTLHKRKTTNGLQLTDYSNLNQ